MKPLEFHPEALAEGEAAAAWYAARNPRVAARFAAELEATLNLIVEAPNRWPVHLSDTRRIPLAPFPFLVFYREEPSRILVVAIAHAR